MLTQEQINELIAALNGPDFADISIHPNKDKALVAAIQQQTKVLRVLAVAVLHALPVVPPSRIKRPTSISRGKP